MKNYYVELLRGRGVDLTGLVGVKADWETITYADGKEEEVLVVVAAFEDQNFTVEMFDQGFSEYIYEEVKVTLHCAVCGDEVIRVPLSEYDDADELTEYGNCWAEVYDCLTCQEYFTFTSYSRDFCYYPDLEVRPVESK